jgi:hypothetical protein
MKIFVAVVRLGYNLYISALNICLWTRGCYNKRSSCWCWGFSLWINGQPNVLAARTLGWCHVVLPPVIGSPFKPSLAARAENYDLPLFYDKGDIITCPTGLCISWLGKSVVNDGPQMLGHWGDLGSWPQLWASDQAVSLLLVKFNTKSFARLFLWSHSDLEVFDEVIMPKSEDSFFLQF